MIDPRPLRLKIREILPEHDFTMWDIHEDLDRRNVATDSRAIARVMRELIAEGVLVQTHRGTGKADPNWYRLTEEKSK